MEDLFSKLISDKKLTINDDPFLVENFIDIKKYISWDVLNDAINSNIVYWEIIGHDGKKIDIPFKEPFWFKGHQQQNKSFIKDYVNAGYTFVISRSSVLNNNLKLITSAIQKTFHVSADIHIYGSKGGSGSFGPHADMPANFIIQIEGETEWVVFKNKVSNMLSLYHRDDNFNNLDPMLEHRAKPGDLIYVPSRYYHCALPNSPRLSISIPCFNPMEDEVNRLQTDTNIYNING